MGRSEEKRIFIVGFVCSLIMFGLLTTPALAGPPVPDAVCQQRAQGIQDRANADAADADIINNFGNSCPNPCTGATGETVSGQAFLRSPGQAQAEGGILTAVISTFVSTGDTLYTATFFGPVAFFCTDGSVVVAAGSPSPAEPSGQQQQCGIFKELCRVDAP